jgi:hypothetical protein
MENIQVREKWLFSINVNASNYALHCGSTTPLLGIWESIQKQDGHRHKDVKNLTDKHQIANLMFEQIFFYQCFSGMNVTFAMMSQRDP